MPKSALALLFALLLAGPAAAQIVRVTRTDGKIVQGELLGYERGRYRLSLPGGRVEEIDDSQVQDVVLVSPAPESKMTAREAAAYEAARAAFDRNEYELALQKISQALKDLDDDRSQLGELTVRISVAYLDRLLEQRDAAAFAEGLRRLTPALAPDARRVLLLKLAEQLADLHRTAPDAPFTGSLAASLAPLIDEGVLPEEARESLAELFLQRAQTLEERRDYAAAFKLVQGASRIDPKRRELLKDRLAGLAENRVRFLLEKGDAKGALEAAREALALDGSNPAFRRLFDDAELAVLKLEVDAGGVGPAQAEALRRQQSRELKPEQRSWIEQALARMGAREPAPVLGDQLQKYYPVQAGRFQVYRRGDGEFLERSRIDSVGVEKGTTRVYTTASQVYRDYTTKKTYLVELDRDQVVLVSGTERELLLKFPARVGDSWSWEAKGRDFRRQVKAVGESVVVGRDADTRTYEDCLIVEFTSTGERDGTPVTMVSRSTYAAGIGLVKLEFPDAAFARYNLELVEAGQD